MSLFDSTQVALETAMRGAEMRQTLLTDNLANVNTPGYQRKDLDFRAQLREAEMSGASAENVSFQPSTDATRTVRADGSGIDADQESAELAKNGLDYEAMTQLLTARNNIVQIAMGARS